LSQLVFKKWQILAIKNIAKKIWQTFWKTVHFGNICQIWHHLATLSADTVSNKGIEGIPHPRYPALLKLQISGKISFKVALKSKLFLKHLEF